MNARVMDFPSVLDLGRLAGAVSRGMKTHDTADNRANPGTDTGGTLCLDLWEHLHGIVAGRRAETLGDVAAQLVTAFVVLDWLDGGEEASEAEARRMLRRIVLGALPVVAAAGNVDLAELDAAYLLGFADHAFPPVTAPALPDGGGDIGFGRAAA